MRVAVKRRGLIKRPARHAVTNSHEQSREPSDEATSLHRTLTKTEEPWEQKLVCFTESL